MRTGTTRAAPDFVFRSDARVIRFRVRPLRRGSSPPRAPHSAPLRPHTLVDTRERVSRTLAPTPLPAIALRTALASVAARAMAPLARSTRAAALGSAGRNKDWENPTITQKNRCVVEGVGRGREGKLQPPPGAGGRPFWRLFAFWRPSLSTPPTPPPTSHQLPPPRPAALVQRCRSSAALFHARAGGRRRPRAPRVARRRRMALQAVRRARGRAGRRGGGGV